MRRRSLRFPAIWRSARRALLVGAGLMAALCAPAAARPSDCPPDGGRFVRAFDSDRLWDALAEAESCAGRRFISEGRRAEALETAGRLRALVGDLPGARHDLSRALTLSPRDPLILSDLARASRENPEDALRDADDAVAASTAGAERAAALRLAGEIRLDLGDDAGARNDLTRALDEGGDDLAALADLAAADRASAARWAERAQSAAAAAPSWERGAALLTAARIWENSGQPARAAGCLRLALALDPDDLDALEDLARLRLDVAGTSEPPAASSAVAPAADELEALRSRIERAAAEGKRKDAAALCERFMLAASRADAWRQPDAYRLAARLWAALGGEDKAAAALERLHDIDPQSLKTQLLDQRYFPAPQGGTTVILGFLYGEVARLREQLGDVPGAEAALKRGLVVVPGNQQLRNGLARLEALKP